MSLGGYVHSEFTLAEAGAELVRAVRAERKAIVNLVLLEVERRKAAQDECLEAGDEEEAERHKQDAETLTSIAREIEKRGGRAP